MSVTIEAGVLSRAMKSAAGIVEARDTIPILSNVRLRAVGEQLEIITSNSEIEYRQLVPLVTGGDLLTTVNARKMAALASAAESGAQIVLALKDHDVIAKAGRSRWTLPTLPAATFPEMPFEIESNGGATMSGKVLASIVARLSWSICREATRHYICGIHIDPERDDDGATMRLTSTTGDAFASIISDTPWPADAPAVTIPTGMAKEMARIAVDADTLHLAWDSAKIRMVVGNITLTGMLIDGQFPDYRRVIHAGFDNPILVDPDAARRALRRIEIVGLDKTREILVDAHAGELELQVARRSNGEASEHVPANCEDGFRTAFDYNYLAGALEAIGGDTVEIHQAAFNQLALIRRAVPDGAICGLMPMRI
ncbi:DNA polymerase III subunit beta [uncultured Novosphingobium sp.]|uniref:DNA polymerase III subunit beta n=1 Tax=uncultured Novosphingobium sp. TaxID=292277 RepID=UPI00374A2D52